MGENTTAFFINIKQIYKIIITGHKPKSLKKTV
jgi:hypothetical protein